MRGWSEASVMEEGEVAAVVRRLLDDVEAALEPEASSSTATNDSNETSREDRAGSAQATPEKPRPRSFGHRRGDSWEPTPQDVRWLAGALAEARSHLGDAARLRDLETCIELERENSHLYLSEMLISAVEQMKWRQVLATQHFLPSAAAALPRAQSQRAFRAMESSAEEEYPASEVSLSRVASPAPSSEDGFAFCPPHGRLTRYTSSSGPELSSVLTRSLESPGLESSAETGNSAEVVAHQLLANIAHMSQGRGPGALLVPFDGAPQELLPMPLRNEFAHAGDDGVGGRRRAPQPRGEWFAVADAGRPASWAPAKPHIISSRHPEPRVKRDTERQGNRCAGCGRGFYLKRVRYCDYLGKWFCLVCHVGATAQIPARVLSAWDFRPYPVCDASLAFLGANFSAPLFELSGQPLYGRVKALRLLRLRRRHLRSMWDYLRSCRVAAEVLTKDGLIIDMFLSLPVHFLESEDVYSMKDLNLVRDGTMDKLLDRPLSYGRTHIEGCLFCRAKGFHCLFCADKPRKASKGKDEPELLFPFQTDKVSRCRDCGSVSHTACWAAAKRGGQPDCPFCERRRRRRLSLVPEAEVLDSGATSPAGGMDGTAAGEEAAAQLLDYAAPVRLI